MQIESVRQRSLDIAFINRPPEDQAADLDYALVLSEPMLLALPCGHPLADKAHIEAEDLDGAAWIAIIPEKNTGLRDNFTAVCIKAGFNPDICLETNTHLTALGLITADLGLTLVQNSLQHHVPAGLVLRPLPWLPYHAQLWAGWHKANLRPLVVYFRQMLIHRAEQIPQAAINIVK